MHELTDLKASIFFFDVCGTLYNCNTTLEFLRFLQTDMTPLQRGRFYLQWIAASAMRRLHLTSPASYMRLRVRCLRGFSHALITERSRQFAQSFLQACKHKQGYSLLEEALGDSSRVVLISYTLQSLLTAIAADLSVERVIGSSLEFDAQGICTGRYQRPLHGEGKLKILRENYASGDIRQSFFLTDDASADQDLLDEVAYPYLLTDRGVQTWRNCRDKIR